MDDGEGGDPAVAEEGESPAEDISALRRRVEETYDFESFGPADMTEMSREEWEAVFDPDSWVTGQDLLDRVEADLARRIADRDVFARVERLEDPSRLVAYSDEGYAVVGLDGSVRGRGTVRRDVEPAVALCSIPDYEVPEAPEDEALPRPMEVPEGSGEFGNRMLQVVAAAQVLAGLIIIGAWLLLDLGLVSMVAGPGFLFVGLILLLLVANARLSDRFRAEEYRNRLRAVGLESAEAPAFLAAARGEAPEPSRWANSGVSDGDEPDGERPAGDR